MPPAYLSEKHTVIDSTPASEAALPGTETCARAQSPGLAKGCGTLCDSNVSHEDMMEASSAASSMIAVARVAAQAAREKQKRSESVVSLIAFAEDA